MVAYLVIATIIYGGVIVPFVRINTYFRRVVMSVYAVVFAYYAALLATAWVLYQYNKGLRKNKEVRNTPTTLKRHHRSLESIVATTDGFDLFANHLVKEFSIENLAFVFEMMQIKHQAIAHGYVL